MSEFPAYEPTPAPPSPKKPRKKPMKRRKVKKAAAPKPAVKKRRKHRQVKTGLGATFKNSKLPKALAEPASPSIASLFDTRARIKDELDTLPRDIQLALLEDLGR